MRSGLTPIPGVKTKNLHTCISEAFRSLRRIEFPTFCILAGDSGVPGFLGSNMRFLDPRNPAEGKEPIFESSELSPTIFVHFFGVEPQESAFCLVLSCDYGGVEGLNSAYSFIVLKPPFGVLVTSK